MQHFLLDSLAAHQRYPSPRSNEKRMFAFGAAGDHSHQLFICSNERLRAWAFSSSNADHIEQLKKMGIKLHIMSDGRIQLSHQTIDVSQGSPSKS